MFIYNLKTIIKSGLYEINHPRTPTSVKLTEARDIVIIIAILSAIPITIFWSVMTYIF
jgi:predicted aconitase with swiveling domain